MPVQLSEPAVDAGQPRFKLARASGLRISDWQNVILVNMLGQRFYDETGDQFTANNAGDIKPYVHGSHLNATNIKYAPRNFINAALAGIGDGTTGAARSGPSLMPKP